MKLDPLGPVPDDPFVLAPTDWTMDVHHEGNMYTAEVKREGVLLCRLSIASENGDDASARTALARKARLWIRDYLSRE